MNKMMLTRLEKIEGAPGGMLPGCIVRTIIGPDGRERDPVAYKDARGNGWRREPGESLDAFRDRAVAGAVAVAPIGCPARIVGEVA